MQQVRRPATTTTNMAREAEQQEKQPGEQQRPRVPPEDLAKASPGGQDAQVVAVHQGHHEGVEEVLSVGDGEDDENRPGTPTIKARPAAGPPKVMPKPEEMARPKSTAPSTDDHEETDRRRAGSRSGELPRRR